ncbi:MAG: EF-hand domain-containing protein [Myxococcales bacterium]|nr:EF-hand domain-containing protein [Myxococcales bacterium]MCB9706343.1 EF-hand domain-containing protein [Myxococcales bacterium]
MLSDLQIRKLTHLFHLHDANGNGFVERTDYERLVGRLLGQREREPAGIGALREVWRSHWQEVSGGGPPQGSARVPLGAWIELWTAILEAGFGARVLGLCEHLFAGMDIDGDGKITADESRQWFEIFGLDPAGADATFAACDLNGDGFITRDEWIQLVDQFFFSDDPAAPGNLLFGALAANEEHPEHLA